MSNRIDLFTKLLGAAVVLAFCGYLAISPAAADAPEGCNPSPTQVPANNGQPPNLDLIKLRILHYRCSQYDSDVAAVLVKAKRWIAKRASQVARPAVVLDIDETSLSNWTRIYRDGYAYFAKGPCDLDKSGEPCGDLAWQASEQAPALKPTRDLYNFARCNDVRPPCKKVEVFFITGRHVNDKKVEHKTPTEWTVENLGKAGYKGIEPHHLYLRPANSSGPVAPYKTGARIDIEKRFNVTIIANVGDQYSDLAGGHAERTFKVPNPFYYIP
jgi:predicted secreted acid phosphatase